MSKKIFCKRCGVSVDKEKSAHCASCETLILEDKKKAHKKKWGVGKVLGVVILVVVLLFVRFVLKSIEQNSPPYSYDTLSEARESLLLEIRNDKDGILGYAGEGVYITDVDFKNDILSYDVYVPEMDLDLLTSQEKEDLFGVVGSEITTEVCTDGGTRQMVNVGITIEYDFFGPDGVRAFTHIIDAYTGC